MQQVGNNIVLEKADDAVFAAEVYALHVGDRTLSKATELLDAFAIAKTPDDDTDISFPLELSEHTTRQVRWALYRERALAGDGVNMARRRLRALAAIRLLDLPSRGETVAA